MQNQIPSFQQYRAPSVSPEAVWLYNSLCIRQSPWNFTVGRASCSADLLPALPEFSPACSIDFLLDEMPCTAELSGTSLLYCHPSFAADSSEEIATLPLPDQICRAVLLALAEPVLQSLGNALGASVAVSGASLLPAHCSGTAAALGFKLRFRYDGSEDVLFAVIHARSARHLSEAGAKLRALPVRRTGVLTQAAQAIPFKAGFEAGYAGLSPDEVKNLAAGDVVIPEAWSLPESLKLCIRHGCDDLLAAECSLNGSTATLTSPLQDETTMEHSDVKNLELRLTFELEQRLITLAELEALAPGYTFALNCANDAPVTIRANGMPLAQGRLVDINGTLGVQLTKTM